MNYIDTVSKAIKPGDNFYSYVNEHWLKEAKIPAGFPSYNSFTEVYLKTEAQVHDIIQELAAHDYASNTPEGQTRALYVSYNNTAKLDELGLKPIQPELDAIAQATSKQELAKLMGHPMYPGIVNFGPSPDYKNPDRYLVVFAQASLPLPSKDFYLKVEPAYQAIRTAYTGYIAQLLQLAGHANPQENAAALLAFEVKLASGFWTPTERRDPVRNYHLVSPADLAAYAPGFDWQILLDEAGMGDQKEFVINTDSAVQATAKLFADASLEDIKLFMTCSLLHRWAPLLSTELDNTNFAFSRGVLQGVKQQRPREQRAIETINTLFAEPLGKIYVEKYFPAEHKAELERLIKYMKQVFRSRLEKLDWMDEETRKEALEKIDKVDFKIGYPDQWHDYSSMNFKDDDLVGNVRQIVAWDHQDSLARLKEPRRRWEWYMAPQTINAYYLPIGNEVVFPAAILQPPFFDIKADPSENFGTIVAVIGHELGHGFDDKGSQSDENGVLRNWWTKQSRDAFEQRTKVLVDQYNQYSPLEGLHVNGELTLGENIGDLGGLSIAYAAYQLFLKDNPTEHPADSEAFTGEQRFFLANATLWRNLTTNEALRQQVMVDPHSPGEYRVNGVVRNMDGWYEAFGLDESSKMFLPPDQRVRIW